MAKSSKRADNTKKNQGGAGMPPGGGMGGMGGMDY
jgi:hypothetical protein